MRTVISNGETASSHEPQDWHAIDWHVVERNVRTTQKRIAKATQVASIWATTRARLLRGRFFIAEEV